MGEGSTDVLVVTGGHRVDLDALLGMVDAICTERGWRWASTRHPNAQRWLDGSRRFDAVLLHDIAGLDLARGRAPRPVGPDPGTVAQVEAMFAAGQGLVVTHHALASWPAWDGWADAVGGRFLYAPGRLRGREWPSSGTRIDRYRVRIADPGHPVCEGLEDFDLDDELYLCPVFDDEVVPLARAAVTVDPADYISTYEHVIHGEQAAPRCSGHPAGSDLAAWATSAAASPIVYVQPGDCAATFESAPYRRLIANALGWVASPDAARWAGARQKAAR